MHSVTEQMKWRDLRSDRDVFTKITLMEVYFMCVIHIQTNLLKPIF